MILLIKPASSLCNMRCKYCFYTDVSNKRETKSFGMMSVETLEILVKKALSHAKDFCNFVFQGGEPTLAGIEFYKKLIEFQEKYNINNVKIFNSIQTNGLAIDGKWASFLHDNNFLVGLSLDGYKEIHDYMRLDCNNNGTFDKVLQTAQLFDEYKVEYNILCVINNFVARHPEKVYNFYKKNNFKYLQFIPCIDGFDGKKQEYSLSEERHLNFLKTIFDLYYKDFMSNQYVSIRTFDNWIGMLMGRAPESCAMAGFCSCYFVIEGDGSVYPCDFYVLDKWRLGNIFNDDFDLMQKSDVAIEFVEGSKYKDEKCVTCKWYSICRGGCRRNREPFINGQLSLNEYCNVYSNFFEYAMPKMQKIALKLLTGACGNEQ